MAQYVREIIHQGDGKGNGMVVRFRLPSGLDIIGLPSKNFYSGDWDLGPTWNYLVLTDTPFLVDSGRFGAHFADAMLNPQGGLRFGART